MRAGAWWLRPTSRSSTWSPGTQFFQISFEQPVDHEGSGGPVFLQRLTLLHRSETAPMVLALEGYNGTQGVAQREITAYLEANQLQVEHRFFPPSSPDPRPWPDLTIAQSAADHHRIVESFKGLYAAQVGVDRGQQGRHDGGLPPLLPSGRRRRHRSLRGTEQPQPS
jgi:hypothetical protein